MQCQNSRCMTSRVTWLVVPLLTSCATARLDPERNQALTFDTTPPSDAGVAPQVQRAATNRTAPSQPGSSSDQATPHTTAGDGSPPVESIRCTQDPPDPKPTSSRDWIAIEFEFVDGAARAQKFRRVQTSKPRDSARVVGRHAVELWIGCELIDRVRFSFPLQAAEGPTNVSQRRPLHEQPSLTAHAHLSAVVLVPFSDRATRAELVDRGNGSRVSLAWPPNLTAAGTEKVVPRSK
jgi:hypothetical protein